MAADRYRRIVAAMWIAVILILGVFFWQFGLTAPTWIYAAVIAAISLPAIRAQRRTLSRLRATPHS
jgi:cellobiose-specific phosphotransferase system component IIC